MNIYNVHLEHIIHTLEDHEFKSHKRKFCHQSTQFLLEKSPALPSLATTSHPIHLPSYPATGTFLFLGCLFEDCGGLKCSANLLPPLWFRSPRHIGLRDPHYLLIVSAGKWFLYLFERRKWRLKRVLFAGCLILEAGETSHGGYSNMWFYMYIVDIVCNLHVCFGAKYL